MSCKHCKYNGGFIKDETTYSGLHFVCNAPVEHLKENYWKRAEGAVLPGRHCHSKEDAETC